MHGHTAAGLTKGVHFVCFFIHSAGKAIQVINVILYWKLKARSLSQIEKKANVQQKKKQKNNPEQVSESFLSCHIDQYPIVVVFSNTNS